MNRSLCVLSVLLLAVLLLACVALAAPAPEPLLPGWGKPIDPDKDCKIRRGKDSLTIEMPGSDHDYDAARKRLNAPRIARELEGDFEIQLRLRIDCRPSAESSVKGQPSNVSAGFLVIFPNTAFKDFICWQYGVAREGAGADGYVSQWEPGGKGGSGSRVWDNRWQKWPFKAKPDQVYLRLERWGNIFIHSISPDGKLWVPSGGTGLMLGLPSKLRVGLLACSNSSDKSKVYFDQIKLTRGHKREQWEFVSGWGKPVDPDKDCKIKRDKDALTIEMPGSDHDYDPIRKRFNAPRLISNLEGRFDLQVRVRIDYRPSPQSTVEGQPSFVSAGFLLIYPEDVELDIRNNLDICNRLDFAVSLHGSKPDAYAVAPYLREPRRKIPASNGIEADSYAVVKNWGHTFDPKHNGKKLEWERGTPKQRVNGILERGWQNWPLAENAEYAYLRLDHREDWSCIYISPDGEKWTEVEHLHSLPAKGKLALAAYSTSTEPSKVRFDQLKLWRGKKKSK